MTRRDMRELATAALLVALGLGALFYFTACTLPIELDVGIGVDLNDPCLTRLPSCGPITGYVCENADGTDDLDCEVACVAGRTLVCEEDGPTCLQRVGEDELWVPVICISNGFGDL